MSKTAREELIGAALRGEVELQPIQRERLDPRGIKPSVVEEIAEGYEVRVALRAVHENLDLHWTERRLVIRAQAYARAQATALAGRLARAETELRDLVVRKQGNRRLDNRQTREAANEIIARHEVQDLVSATVTTKVTRRKVRGYQDRPEQTRSKTTVRIAVERHERAIKEGKDRRGWRVYATNHPDFSLREAVLAYRDQYRIEDGISRLKGRPLGLAPLFLQTESRMVGLLHLLTICLRVLTLVEFQVRNNLKTEGKPLTGIYAGQKGRQTARPSTELLLEALQGIDAAIGTINGSFITYLRPLTETQKRILSLLGLEENLYEKLLAYFQNLAPE